MLTKQEVIALLTDFRDYLQLPIILLNENLEIITYSDAFYQLPEHYFKEKGKNIDFNHFKTYTYYSKSELYCFFPVMLEDIKIVCIGPILTLKINRSTSLENVQFFQDLGYNALTPAMLQQMSYVNSTMSKRISMLYYLINGSRITAQDIKQSAQKDASVEPNVTHQMTKELYHQRENDNSILSYHLEIQLLDYVKKGNSMGARGIYSEMIQQGGVHALSVNAVRSAQFSFVALITLMTRAVIEVNVPEVQAYTMSDVYIKQADDVFTVNQIHHMCNAAIIDYTRLVKLHRNKSDLHWIRLCKEYIDEHLHEEITLTNLAQHVHMNSSYLSVQFKKIAGQSIKEYTNQQKIKEAQFLLRNTMMSIQDIAYSLHYGSENYFTKVFKSYTNILPSHYRNNKNS